MFPGSSTSPTALFHGCGNHLKLLECVAGVMGEIQLKVRSLQGTGAWFYRQKRTGASQLNKWQISFMRHRIISLPKNCSQTLEGRRTKMSQTCYVCPFDQIAPYCSFAMVLWALYSTDPPIWNPVIQKASYPEWIFDRQTGEFFIKKVPLLRIFNLVIFFLNVSSIAIFWWKDMYLKKHFFNLTCCYSNMFASLWKLHNIADISSK